MATPQPDSYSAASGQGIYAGRYTYGPLLDLIANADELSWINANTNYFSDVWPHSDYSPLFGAGAAQNKPIITAWSSFAWDSVNHRMILWGGGHANTSTNAVYVWDGKSMSWELGFYSSDVIANTSGHQTIDGPMSSPVSSHTYDNQVYLTELNRFVTFGGAAHSSGAQFVVTDEAGDTVRSLQGYMLDLAKAGQGYVGGVTGSNPHRGTTVSVDLPGANAWTPLDYLLDNPYASVLTATSGINGFTHHTVEGGVDVVYKTTTALGSMFKITFAGYDYRDHVIEKVGRYWSGASAADQGGAIDTVNNVAVGLSSSSSTPLYGWDLDLASPTNNNFATPDTGLSGTGAAEFLADFGVYGMDYDSSRGVFVAWGRGGAVYTLEAPTNNDYSTGWVVTKIGDPTSPRPLTAAELIAASASDSGVGGKFKYAPDLDCYVGLQHDSQGNIWLFKPANWVDPR